jgi:hypothetical protein
MRLAFICSSLEPGRDGVGDYTLRLAGEMIRQGHPSVAISLNDPHVSRTTTESQSIEGNSVPVLRLPGTSSSAERGLATRNYLANFHPDWISLQLVPFGFHPKGLCFGLGRRLQAFNTKAAWHIMFHELWLGLGEGSSAKHRVWGALQRRIVMDLVRRLRPRIVNTQAEAHRIVLSREKIDVSILPLHSNIPLIAGDGWSGLLEPLVTKAARRPQARDKLYLAGILGAVYPEWSAEQTVNTLFPLVQRFNKRLVLVFHGKNNLTPEAVNKLRTALQDRADIVVTGERSALEVSLILQTVDIGLATTPRQMLQKSGSVAVMLEHGLQVLVTRDDWHLRGMKPQLPEPYSQLLTPKEFALLETLPVREMKPLGNNSVGLLAGRLLAAMESTPPAAGSGLA